MVLNDIHAAYTIREPSIALPDRIAEINSVVAPKDVVFGVSFNDHPGSEHCKKVIDDFYERYKEAPSNGFAKSQVIDLVVGGLEKDGRKFYKSLSNHNEIYKTITSLFRDKRAKAAKTEEQLERASKRQKLLSEESKHRVARTNPVMVAPKPKDIMFGVPAYTPNNSLFRLPFSIHPGKPNNDELNKNIISLLQANAAKTEAQLEHASKCQKLLSAETNHRVARTTSVVAPEDIVFGVPFTKHHGNKRRNELIDELYDRYNKAKPRSAEQKDVVEKAIAQLQEEGRKFYKKLTRPKEIRDHISSLFENEKNRRDVERTTQSAVMKKYDEFEKKVQERREKLSSMNLLGALAEYIQEGHKSEKLDEPSRRELLEKFMRATATPAKI